MVNAHAVYLLDLVLSSGTQLRVFLMGSLNVPSRGTNNWDGVERSGLAAIRMQMPTVE